uniref:DNA repair metallo-beta-lactamase domain-containing protein n=1 Tax=Trichuris muris TaxID=70415 RepID=A0A5S6R1I3_TRIMR
MQMKFDLWKHEDLKSRLRKRSNKEEGPPGIAAEIQARKTTQRSITSFIQVKERTVASELFDCSAPSPSSTPGSPKEGASLSESNNQLCSSPNPERLDYGQQTKLTAFFKCSEEFTSRAETPKENTSNKQASPEFTCRSKSRECPFYKFIPGTSCVVDAFMYGYVPQVKMYFLTHFHSDHYSGLNRRFTMPIYCSKVTAKLVALKLKVAQRFLRVLELDQWSTLPDGTAVMAINANHCPGAVMFIFKTKRGELILHTGDFRAEDTVVQNSIWEQVRIDLLFLDTTYCDPAYVFPEQHKVIAEALAFIQAKMQTHPNLLIVIGAYVIGKERIFAAVAEALDCKICVERPKLQVLNCLEDAALKTRLTLEKSDTFLHVMPMGSITKKRLADYLKLYPNYKHVLGILPTGWQFRPRQCSLVVPFEGHETVTLLGVPYSEHSSYVELKRFVQAIRPKRIIPTVNASSKTSRSYMLQTFSRWLEE